MTELNDFVKEVNIILQGLTYNTDYENQEKYFKYIWRREEFLALPHSISDSYNKAISMLKRKATVTSRPVSNQSLESAFESFLFDLLYNKNNEISLANILHKEVGDLFRTIRHLETYEYLVIVPVIHVKAEACFQIGSVEIKKLTADELSKISGKYGVNFVVRKNESVEDVIRGIQDDSGNPTVSITIVESSDHDKAEELAIQATDQALNVLRFYTPSFRGMIKGEELKEVKRSILIANITDKMKYSVKMELCNSVDPLNPDDIIDYNTILILRNHRLGIIHGLLQEKVFPIKEELFLKYEKEEQKE